MLISMFVQMMKIALTVLMLMMVILILLMMILLLLMMIILILELIKLKKFAPQVDNFGCWLPISTYVDEQVHP